MIEATATNLNTNTAVVLQEVWFQIQQEVCASQMTTKTNTSLLVRGMMSQNERHHFLELGRLPLQGFQIFCTLRIYWKRKLESVFKETKMKNVVE